MNPPKNMSEPCFCIFCTFMMFCSIASIFSSESSSLFSSSFSTMPFLVTMKGWFFIISGIMVSFIFVASTSACVHFISCICNSMSAFTASSLSNSSFSTSSRFLLYTASLSMLSARTHPTKALCLMSSYIEICPSSPNPFVLCPLSPCPFVLCTLSPCTLLLSPLYILAKHSAFCFEKCCRVLSVSAPISM